MFEYATPGNIRSLNFQEGVVLNVNKPPGITSFGVVRKVRGWTRCKKVGHAGTLDPMATGVLLVATGKATKQIHTLVGLDKVYQSRIKLGSSTDTDDAEGHILETRDVPDFSLQEIEKVLTDFTGDICQVPPMYSAIKVDGKPLYKLARKGKVIERQPRTVQVHSIVLKALETPFMDLEVTCSKGTYIRALARDIGEKLGTGGHVFSLERSAIGSYRIEDSMTLDTVKELLA